MHSFARFLLVMNLVSCDLEIISPLNKNHILQLICMEGGTPQNGDEQSDGITALLSCWTASPVADSASCAHISASSSSACDTSLTEKLS